MGARSTWGGVSGVPRNVRVRACCRKARITLGDENGVPWGLDQNTASRPLEGERSAVEDENDVHKEASTRFLQFGLISSMLITSPAGSERMSL